MAKTGRKTKYNKEYIKQVYKLCLLNATDAQIADYFSVSESTLNLWKLRYKEFSESLKRGKEHADAEVAEALFHRACGYSHPDVHISNFQGEITVTNITKHYPPDTAAAFIWLKNRAGWKDKTEHVLRDDDRLSAEEREDLREILRQRQRPLKLVKGA
jgi:hypothetical protein